MAMTVLEEAELKARVTKLEADVKETLDILTLHNEFVIKSTAAIAKVAATLLQHNEVLKAVTKIILANEDKLRRE